MIDISDVMATLATRRQLFHSEADFQHAFAWEAHSRLPNGFVRLEYPFPVGEKVLHLDCWFVQSGHAVAVELKYKTRGLSAEVSGEKYQLADHSAQDLGRYDFLKDIQRLEQITSTSDGTIGQAILLTNDSAYWSEPTAARTADADFRLSEGRTIGKIMHWGDKAGKGTTVGRESPISLLRAYRLQWRDFSMVGTGRYSRFRYLAIAVPSYRASTIVATPLQDQL